MTIYDPYTDRFIDTDIPDYSTPSVTASTPLMSRTFMEITFCRDCLHYYLDSDNGMSCGFLKRPQPATGYCNWAKKR